MKPLKNKIAITGIFLVVFLIFEACAPTTTIYSDKVEGVDFSEFSTYAWLPHTDTGETSIIYNNEIVRQNIRKEINKEMTKRGYSIDADDPDLLVMTHLMFKNKKYYDSHPVYSSYPYAYPGFTPLDNYPYYYNDFYNVPSIVGYDIHEVEYTEGTIVIDVINAENNKLIWRGWTEKVVEPQSLQEDLKNDIQRIFKEYPVQPETLSFKN